MDVASEAAGTALIDLRVASHVLVDDQVGLADDPDQALVRVDHGYAADVLREEELHEILDPELGVHGDRRPRHDLGDRDAISLDQLRADSICGMGPGHGVWWLQGLCAWSRADLARACNGRGTHRATTIAVTTELRPDELFRRCDPSTLPFDSTADHAGPLEIVGQRRALEAARFAIGMRGDGYNVFALGPEGIGKQTVLRQVLEREAAQQPAPADWCHVFDFASPRRPRALAVPAGTAPRLRDSMRRAIAGLRVALPAAFETDGYRRREHQLAAELKRRQKALFDDLQRRARARDVGVVRTEGGIAVAPLRGDAVIDDAELETLPESERVARRRVMEEVGAEITAMTRTFDDWARQHVEARRTLEREVAAAVTREVIDGVRAGSREPAVLEHLAAIERDVVDHVERFTPKGDEALPEMLRRALHPHDEDRWQCYEVNVIATHGAGAPVICEENPTYANLIGRIEHVSELGALVTNFTLIRPGALHRANGGYLLLDAVKLLHQPFAWEALKRALRTRQIRIEPLGQTLGMVSTVSLEPEPIPLDVKVILFGDHAVYGLLATLDPELEDLFKVVADFEASMDRDERSQADYAKLIAGLVHHDRLRAFDRGAIARVIEQASRLADDREKLSIHLRSLSDLLREADDQARREDRPTVTAADVQAAIDGQQHRFGRVRDQMLESIKRNTILIDTGGDVIGQVNGLSVVQLGGHLFGYPTRITARARLGAGEVIDIEREVELGGPIHSKGVLILAALLAGRYAQHTPLSLSATIVFEQSYSGVEGDSASLAELCVLLSAIADLPIHQGVAVTGSVNQRGEVQPIGGINAKVEGFFDVCRERGLTGDQAVVIPQGNIQHLMLRADVVAAVASGRFHVHAVRDVDEAISLLTGRAAGTRAGNGRFAEGSVNALVEARLARFAEDLRRFAIGPHEKWQRHAG